MSQMSKNELLSVEEQLRIIVSYVAKAFDIVDHFALSETGDPEMIPARNVGIWIAKKLTPASNRWLASAFGIERSQALASAVQRVEHIRNHNPDYRRMVDELYEEVQLAFALDGAIPMTRQDFVSATPLATQTDINWGFATRSPGRASLEAQNRRFAEAMRAAGYTMSGSPA